MIPLQIRQQNRIDVNTLKKGSIRRELRAGSASVCQLRQNRNDLRFFREPQPKRVNTIILRAEPSEGILRPAILCIPGMNLNLSFSGFCIQRACKET